MYIVMLANLKLSKRELLLFGLSESKLSSWSYLDKGNTTGLHLSSHPIDFVLVLSTYLMLRAFIVINFADCLAD